MNSSPIPYLRIEEINDAERLRQIYEDSDHSHYWTTDWSPQTYVALAKAGFISTHFHHPELGGILLPEMQREYAVLDWRDLKMGRTMRRWINSPACRDREYRLSLDHDLQAVISGIEMAHGNRNWLRNEYVHLLMELEGSNAHPDFRLRPMALIDKRQNVVAGEIGYQVGMVYTSLTGFMNRSDKTLRNVGKYQLYLLAEQLQKSEIEFWNLGHPYMDYKLELGAKILDRQRFLQRWPTFES
tara:strand:- start:6957 stop:7682 length:726 start_codon:yes stop_codon:yes gene_type:complete